MNNHPLMYKMTSAPKWSGCREESESQTKQEHERPQTRLLSSLFGLFVKAVFKRGHVKLQPNIKCL